MNIKQLIQLIKALATLVAAIAGLVAYLKVGQVSKVANDNKMAIEYVSGSNIVDMARNPQKYFPTKK